MIMCIVSIVTIGGGGVYYYKYVKNKKVITKAVVNYKPRQQIIDLGNPNLPGKLAKGWYDIQKQGAKNDYCAYIGNPPIWNCALAGDTTYTVENEEDTEVPRVAGHQPRQVISDLGYPNKPGILTKGWYDVQDQGINNDYCSYTGSATNPENWGCALAGGIGYTHQDESQSPAIRIKLNERQSLTDKGYEDSPGNLIKGYFDLQGQGNDNDYCAYTGSSATPNNWGCAMGGGNGYTHKDENSFSKWKRIPIVLDKGFRLRGEQGKCITIPNDSKDNGVEVEMRDCVNTQLGQQFNKVGSNYGYSIKNVNSGKCLDVPYGDSNRNIQLYDCNGSPAQMWGRFRNQPDSDTRIFSYVGSTNDRFHTSLNIRGGANNPGDKLLAYNSDNAGANAHWTWIKN